MMDETILISDSSDDSVVEVAIVINELDQHGQQEEQVTPPDAIASHPAPPPADDALLDEAAGGHQAPSQANTQPPAPAPQAAQAPPVGHQVPEQVPEEAPGVACPACSCVVSRAQAHSLRYHLERHARSKAEHERARGGPERHSSVVVCPFVVYCRTVCPTRGALFRHCTEVDHATEGNWSARCNFCRAMIYTCGLADHFRSDHADFQD